ncbi:DUF397 domain-containing protein [Kitasatospora sp. NPDC006697]|uniref:DUF397 domain-containing protein n=1 Tax=Kitasatospora sp. NPDC006697 TaxID=3364020 RepID=UPI0036BAB830
MNLTATVWRKSSFSDGNGECVEVAIAVPGAVPVRDSKDPHGPALVFAPGAWNAFLAKVHAGGVRGEA